MYHAGVSLIYMDHNATTPMRPEAVDAVAAAALEGGNPSSIHRSGQQARQRLDDARRAVQDLVGAAGAEVVLTSGGTEADNLAIWGLAQRRRAETGARVLVLSDLEHPAVRESATRLTAAGFQVVRVPVNSDGRIDLDAFPTSPTLDETALVAVMLANNETGVIQPVAGIGAITGEAKVPLHVDAVQGAGKIHIDFNALGASSLALSAHKLGGPRGIGALVVAKGVQMEPFWYRGREEAGFRPGTAAVALASGMAAAADLARSALGDPRIAELRDRLETRLVRELDGCFVVGATAPRLPNTSAIGFAGVPAQTLVRRLNEQGFFIGSGAACHGDTVRVSAVLTAMGIPVERALEVVRISIGWSTEPDEIDRIVAAITAAVAELRG